jgi:hypothetical protein
MRAFLRVASSPGSRRLRGMSERGGLVKRRFCKAVVADSGIPARNAASHADYCTDQLSARQKRGVWSEHVAIIDALNTFVHFSCVAANQSKLNCRYPNGISQSANFESAFERLTTALSEALSGLTRQHRRRSQHALCSSAADEPSPQARKKHDPHGPANLNRPHPTPIRQGA